MNKFMRIMVYFDLPTQTAEQRKSATQFRKALLFDGYTMLQYSVYTRICNGMDEVYKHMARLHYQCPALGAIEAVSFTEKQFEERVIILGQNRQKEEKPLMEQLTIF